MKRIKDVQKMSRTFNICPLPWGIQRKTKLGLRFKSSFTNVFKFHNIFKFSIEVTWNIYINLKKSSNLKKFNLIYILKATSWTWTLYLIMFFSQNERTSKMFESAAILSVFDFIGHFHEFWQLFLDSRACNTVYF